ncbi:MAG: hypothetical protein IID39_06685, partial [Planctomycetes bacterium]|nr:hypothetical protein [Planctomycetota bacterium]
GASLTYAAEDRNEQCIPVHGSFGNPARWGIGAYEWGGRSGQGEPLFGNDPVESFWGTANGRGPGTRPLNDVLYKGGLRDYQNNRGRRNRNWINDTQLDLDIYRCPSDRGYTGVHFREWKESGLSSYDHYGNSYVANQFLSNRTGPDPVPWVLSYSPYLHPLSRIPNPGNTLYYLENAGYFAWLMEPDSYRNSNAWKSRVNLESAPVGGWHGQRSQFTVAYVDGHAASTHIEGHMDPPPHLAYYPSQFPYEHGDYPHYAAGIIRGENWQLDVLPAPPARTDVRSSDWVPGTMQHPIE